jgi:hypothetical protein
MHDGIRYRSNDDRGDGDGDGAPPPDSTHV